MSAGAGAEIDRGPGHALFDLVSGLYPICRSITGDGVRDTLRRLQSHVPIGVVEVPSGTPVLDWVVPKEWNIRDAYIKDSRGRRVIDFKRNNLHVLNYSTPLDARMTLPELRPHLFSLPDQPTLIPYRTSYYTENWGFCLTHEQLQSLEDDTYEVRIDSSLADGALTYGEYYLPGATTDEVLISCHICHPSLCNDNLSGISVATFLAKELGRLPRRYSYRFLFVPGTIGAITWLARNRPATERIRHGLVLTCVGDPGAFHYKKSRRGNAEIDRVVAHVLEHEGLAHEIMEFSPYGYDERQYCSPGFDLPVGCLMRSVWGRFPQYHTSADDLSLVTPEALADSWRTCVNVLQVLEHNRILVNTSPYGEPALGRRGLYRATGGAQIGMENMARLWVLNLSDGRHSLLDIADRASIDFATIRVVAEELLQHGLLRETDAQTTPR